MRDIQDKADIKIFIDAFYHQVRKDSLLGPVFASKIKAEDWPKHLERMYGFWNTVLFAQADYRGNPFAKHTSLPIQAAHFEQWIGLFQETINAHFAGDKAEEVKTRANKMSKMFQAKLAHIRSNDQYLNLM